MKIPSMLGVALTLLGGFAERAESQAGGADSARAWRESLRVADETASTAAFKTGIGAALPLAMTDDAVLLWDAAPVVSGRPGIQRLLAAQPSVRVSWQPLRVLVSRDGNFGVTFGATSRYGDGSAPVGSARYITVWRRSAPAGWKMTAHAQIGLVNPDSVKVPAPLPGTLSSTRSPEDPFAAADIAFARMAIDSGAPAAFYHYSASDGMTFAGTGELNIGPDAIRARLAEGAVGKAKWVWRPVITIAAASGELGATVGTAEIQLGPGPNDVFFSKYLSIWKRQPDGSIKFVVDGGSGRPQKP
jgi:ketosteroid isomerase-like protein